MQCCYHDGRAYDLAGHNVTVKLLNPDGTTKVSNSSPTIVDTATGWVRHDWGATDLDTAGDYRVQIEATRTADGRRISFPNTDDPVLVKVRG
jgi:hypothetical protein